MAPRPKVKLLPPEIKAELDRKLVESAFSGAIGLSEWLEGKGYSISRKTIQRYSQQFKARLDALNEQIEFSKAFADRYASDSSSMGELLNGLAQDTLCRVLIQLHQRTQNLTDEDNLGEITRLLTLVTKSLSDINRVDIAVKKYADELQEKQAAKFDSIAQEAEMRGIDQEFVDYVRGTILRLL